MTPFDLFADPERPAHGRLQTIAIGKVTGVDDPEKLGRVKVIIPRISDEAVSHWARVMRPAAGAEHGLHLPFEIDDEVVVAFLDGFAELPVVLGALWSAKQPPLCPEDRRQDHRSLTSRSGHVVRLDDTAGGEKIEIIDAGGKNTLTFDTANGEVTIAAETTINLRAGGEINITGTGAAVAIKCKSLEVTASDGITLGGGAITIASDDTVAINGPSGVTVNDGALEVK